MQTSQRSVCDLFQAFAPVQNYYPQGYTPTAGKDTKNAQGVAWDAAEIGIAFATMRRD